MIEVYATLAVFLVQILVVSVLHPVWLIRYFRGKMELHYHDDRYARFFPGWDRARTDRLLNLVRAASAGIGLLGLVPLYWLYQMMLDPNVDVFAVRAVISRYFVFQMSPFLILAANRIWVLVKARRHAAKEVKRTASLQRRRLFDFVSPATVAIAAVAYACCAGLSLYFLQNPVPEITYPVRPLVMATYVYVVYGALIYIMMYGKKLTLLDSHAERMRETALAITALFYVGIIMIAYAWFNLGLEILHLERWIPVSSSLNFMIIIMVMVRCLIVPPPIREASGGGVPSPAS